MDNPKEQDINSKSNKLTPYYIEYIVRDLLTTEKPTEPPKEDHVKSEDVPQKKLDGREDAPGLPVACQDKMENCEIKYSTDNVFSKLDGENRNFSDSYAFDDKSSEVKHALTPINSLPNPQTHSPQLPSPSPNYPVQSQSVPEMRAANLPNTVVPTINNNYITSPQSASQNGLDKTETDGQIHSMESVNEAVNTNSVKNDEQLTNFSSSECKVRVNTEPDPVNFQKCAKTSPNKCKRSRKSTIGRIVTGNKLTENSFTVLNVPNIPFHGPPIKRPKLSKIDVATIRQKMRRDRRAPRVSHRKTSPRGNKVTTDFGVTVIGYSDSSSGSSTFSSSDSDPEDKEPDLWITTGPPCKLDLSSDKIRFLNLFELTTHSLKNSLEVRKLERRKWLTPGLVREGENEKITPLNLPVPSKSPSILNMVPDFKSKKLFLRLLGLRNVSTDARQEMEENWIKIVEERLRRNCESSLTKYSLKAYRKTIKEEEGKNERADNGTNGSLDMSFKIPIVHQYNERALVPAANLEDCNGVASRRNFDVLPFIAAQEEVNGLPLRRNFEYNYLPLVLVDNQSCAIANLLNDGNSCWWEAQGRERVAETSCLPWPGIEEIMLSYNRYEKERRYEIEQLKRRCSFMKEEITLQQCGANFYEKRQRELHSIVFMNDKRGKQLQKSIDQLTNIINAFR